MYEIVERVFELLIIRLINAIIDNIMQKNKKINPNTNSNSSYHVKFLMT